MDVRIIRIGDVPDNTPVPDFEEAFGEFSDFKGKGRQRRQDRKMDRIQKKSERKTAKQVAKTARKVGRQDTRTAKQGARQGRKIQRQGFKTNRKQMRTDRRAIGQEQEGYDDPQSQDSQYEQPYNETPQQDYIEPAQNSGGAYSEPIDFPTEEEFQDPSGYGDQGGYSEEEGGYEEEGAYEDEGGYEDEGYGFDGGSFSEFDEDQMNFGGQRRMKRPRGVKSSMPIKRLGKVTVVKGVPAEMSPNEIRVDAVKSNFGGPDGKFLGMNKTTLGVVVGIAALAGIIYVMKKK